MNLDANFPSSIGELPEPTCAGARSDQMSLAELQRRILASDLPDKQKTNWTRAIAKSCAWFGLPTEQMLAHPRNVGPRFRRLSPGRPRRQQKANFQH